ncbi:MAG: Trk system potassium transporter TrkA [Clostridia bacterium]|nr:Trk system potassium transporter TrkA [Clostridia bacterium]
MKIVICGLGKIGQTICANLVKEGHDVVVLDTDRDVITSLSGTYDVMGVCGNGADCTTLEEAGVDKAEIFIAVTQSDEINMLASFFAKRLGAKRTIARIRNPEYNDEDLGFTKQELGISMAINPESLAASELFDMLLLPSAVKVETFTRRKFEMVEMKIKENSLLDGLALKELREKHLAKVLVCAVKRDDEVYIPDGNFVLRAGDKIGITAKPSEIKHFFRNIGNVQKKAKNVMIVGGSRTAYYLAKLLKANGFSVKIIEQDRERALSLSTQLDGVTVIHGDGTQHELLREEGLAEADGFVTLTGTDEENILISMYAAAEKVPKVITKVNSPELYSLGEKIGLESLVSPRNIVSDVIVRDARALESSMGSQVETLYRLMDGTVEAIEFLIKEDSKLTNTPLSELKLKDNILIAGIIRGRHTIIPGGSDKILEGDRVVVIVEDIHLTDISDILR